MRRRFRRMATGVLVVMLCGAPCHVAEAQLLRATGAADEAPRDERVLWTAGRLHLRRDADVAMQRDPASAATVRALVDAGRAADAVDAFERIVRTRPAEIALAIPSIQRLRLDNEIEPRWSPLADRRRALLDEGQAALASRPPDERHVSVVPPQPDAASLPTTQPVAAVPADESVVEAMAQIDRAYERLEERRRFEPSAAVKATESGRALLRALMAAEHEPARQQAHAALAAAEFRVGRVREARELLDDYLFRYPDAGWSWVAALHAAQATQWLESPEAAADRFAAVARRFGGDCAVAAIAAFYEARAHDAGGHVAAALDAYQRAQRGLYGPAEQLFGLDWPVAHEQNLLIHATWPQFIEAEAIAGRITELTAAGSRVEGRAEARAQWWLQHRQPIEARAALREVAVRAPALAHDAVFTALRQRAELDAAAATFSRGRAHRNEAVRDLDALCRESFDDWSNLGCIALASALVIDGHEQKALKTFTDAMAARLRHQVAAGPTPAPAPNSIEHDVLAIRDVLFQPRGGGIYGSRLMQRENGDLPPFLVLPAELPVNVVDGTPEVMVPVARQPPGFTNVVFLSTPQHRAVWETAETLSGCEGRHLTRPARLFESVVGWRLPYCAMGGGGGTMPAIGRVAFTNAERTLADVRVETGDFGRLLVMAKVNGVWTFKSVKSSWAY